MYLHDALDEISASRDWVEVAATSPASGPPLEKDNAPGRRRIGIDDESARP
jgi:hypothetical protein